tara:strand:- start:507 stop:740 length:234 start_codon:yes stop_codon:yes gene_type:complete
MYKRQMNSEKMKWNEEVVEMFVRTEKVVEDKTRQDKTRKSKRGKKRREEIDQLTFLGSDTKSRSSSRFIRSNSVLLL